MRFAFWTLVAITLAIYASMLIWTLPRITAAADGHVPFDMRPGGYSFDDAREFLTCLQPDGRTIYLGPQAVLDLIYPGLLAIVLTISLWTLTRSYRFVVRLFIVATPVLGSGFDYLENHAVGVMLRAELDSLTVDMVTAASRWTVLKSVFTSIAMACVVVALCVLAIRRLTGRKASNLE
jgi:hypothetical protein